MEAQIKFLSTKEVAEALGCSLPTARNIMMRADFPLVRVGKNFKVSEQAFIEWSKKRRIEQFKATNYIDVESFLRYYKDSQKRFSVFRLRKDGSF